MVFTAWNTRLLLERKGNFGLKFRHVCLFILPFYIQDFIHPRGCRIGPPSTKYHVHHAMWPKCPRCIHAAASSSERPVESKGGSLASWRRLGTNVKITKTIKSTTSMSPQCRQNGNRNVVVWFFFTNKKNPKKKGDCWKHLGILSKMKSWLIKIGGTPWISRGDLKMHRTAGFLFYPLKWFNEKSMINPKNNNFRGAIG